MKRIDINTAAALHRMISERTGGSPEIRDTGLLISALEAPFAGFGGVETYPTLNEKAARLCYSLVSNHAFVDGNKRRGVLAMLAFLEVNGSPIRPTSDDVISLGLSVADGTKKYEDILSWIEGYTKG